MLTKWKQARTTFEHSVQRTTDTPSKKKRSTNDSSIPPSADIAVSFVKPLARQNPFYIERVKSSKSSDKKRRKSNHGLATDTSIEDLEPILCITSSHRVGVFGRSSAALGATLSESKSRNYVSRPGPSTSFDVTDYSPSSLDGVVPCGAQYDPASNLMYAIRNRSAVAIWTAESSSVIQGPDQSLEAVAEIGSKKRKERTTASFNRVVSEHLVFPEGKVAVTLNSFYFQEQQRLLAVGASGCCEDGTIWIAISRDGNSSFELLFVDGSSMIDKDETSRANKRRGASVKSKKMIGDAANNWKLLDSKATRSLHKDDSFMIDIQSVMLYKSDGSVILRRHHILVSLKEGEKGISHIEKYAKQKILTVPSIDDCTARLDNCGNSLCIVHKNDRGRWDLSSVEVFSVSDEDIAGPMSSIALTRESQKDISLFSFGCLGSNVYAALSKEKCPASRSVLSTLQIVDTRRKVELMVHSWKEGCNGSEVINSTENVLTKMLHDKQCRAMITNELDGSLVLVTSTSSGAIGLISSTMSTDTGSGFLLDHQPSCSSSLALALRATTALVLTEPSATNYSASPINSMGNEEQSDSQKYIEEAVELACRNLSEVAQSVIHYIAGVDHEKKKTTNNVKRDKKSNAKSNPVEFKNWKDAFDDELATIQNAKNPFSSTDGKGTINGIKSEQNRGRNKKAHCESKQFMTTAFKHATLILTAIHKKSKTLSADDNVVLETIRQEAVYVLLRVLQSNYVHSRSDYDTDLPGGGNALIQLFKACPSILLQNAKLPSNDKERRNKVGALDIVFNTINHVEDLSERVLVYMVKFLLRNVRVLDVASYYFKGTSKKASKGSKLAEQLQQLTSSASDVSSNELKSQIETKLVSEALLSFTSKIVTYSKCNLSLLSKALRDILTAAEVETLLATLSKLLKLGISSAISVDHQNLYSRVIDWLSSLTEAHTSNILKMSDEGSLIVNRIQADVRSALKQTHAANELMELSDHVSENIADWRNKKSSISTKASHSKEIMAIAAYTIEKLVF